MTDQNVKEVVQPELPVERLSFSIPEYCIAHNISRSRAYQDIKDGLVKTIHFGRSVRIPRSEMRRRAGELG